MTREEAFELAKSMRKNGATNGAIANKLKSSGYKNIRGQYTTPNGVGYILNHAKINASGKRNLPVAYERIPPAKAPSTPPNGYVMVVIGRPEQMRDIIAGAMQ